MNWLLYADDHNGSYLPAMHIPCASANNNDKFKHYWHEFLFLRNFFGGVKRRTNIYQGWAHVLGYYMDSFICPACPISSPSNYNIVPVMTSYTYNYYINTIKESTPIDPTVKNPYSLDGDFARNPYPSQTSVWMDGWTVKVANMANGQTLPKHPNYARMSKYEAEGNDYNIPNIGRWAAHPGGMNCLYADGHAELQNFVWVNGNDSNYLLAVWRANPGKVIKKP